MSISNQAHTEQEAPSNAMKNHAEKKTSVTDLIQYALDNRKDTSKAIEYIDEAILEAAKIDDRQQLAHALDIKGGLHWFECNFVQASDSMERALTIWKVLENKNRIAESYNNIGTIFYNMGDYEDALNYYLIATGYKEELEDKTGLGRCYFNIGVLYAKREFYKKALDYHSKALTIRQELDDQKGVTASLVSIASIYKQLEHYQLSVEYFLEALKYLEPLEDEHALSQAYYELGEVYNKMDRYHLGLDYLFRALKILEQKPYQADLAICLLKMGRSYVKLRKFSAALPLLERSLDIMNQIDLKKCLDEVYKNMAKAHAELGEYEKSNQYLWKYTHFITQSYQKEKAKAIIEIETQYATEKKQKEIEALNRKQKDLTDRNQELYQFAGKAAHDLKEPLRMIGSFSGLFYRRYADEVDEQGKEFLDIVQDAVKRMNRLVTNLLQYAKAGKNRQKVQQVDLNDALRTVQKNLQLKIQETQAQIEVSQLPTLEANLTNMIQLFQNLIGNGIKFQKPNVRPRIEVRVSEKDNLYCFEIKDNGIGIKEGHQSRIFEAFDRLHSKAEYEGTGLGLAICKKIIEGLEGRIWVESALGKGTTFHFEIPI